MSKLGKRVFLFFFILFLILGFCGCQNNNKEDRLRGDRVIEMINDLPSVDKLTLIDEKNYSSKRCLYDFKSRFKRKSI